MDSSGTARRQHDMLGDPPIARSLFGDVRWAWIWLILRVYVGWQWLQAGWIKLHNPAWSGGQAGAAITAFINASLAKTTGQHPDVQGWYAWFLRHAVLNHAAWWSHLVTAGELLVGIALVLGIFAGVAAFAGLGTPWAPGSAVSGLEGGQEQARQPSIA